MNDLDCCSNFGDLHEQFVLEWDGKVGGVEMSLRSPDRGNETSKRFLLTLYYCPYCGSQFEEGK